MSRRAAAVLSVLALLLVAAAPAADEVRGRGWKGGGGEVTDGGDAPIEGDGGDVSDGADAAGEVALAPGGGSYRSRKTVTVPVSTAITIDAIGCSNNGGPTIRIGEVSNRGPATLDLEFRSPSGQSRKVKDGRATLTVVPADGAETEQFKGGPDGLGGNPYIYLEHEGVSTLLGRCLGNFSGLHRVSRTVDVTISSGVRTRSCAPTETAAEVHDVSASFSASSPSSETVTLWFARDRRSGNRRGVEVPVTFQLSAVTGVATGGRVLGVGGNPEVWVDTDEGFAYAGRCKDLLG